MSLAIVGTDTDVGKTLISALVLEKLKTQYIKPIATGYPRMDDSATVGQLTQHRYGILKTWYGFTLPASPHLAAAHDGKRIPIAACVKRFQSIPEGTVIETAGGVLVPINQKGVTYADILAQTGIPVIVVTRGTLGTLNHTLLTLEALRARHIPIMGIVINGSITLNNRNDLQHFGCTKIIGHVPHLRKLGPLQIKRHAQSLTL